MRLDRYLDVICIVKTRSAAAKLIKSGLVKSGEAPAKASHTVHVGEQLSLELPDRTLTIEIVEIPEGSVSKSRARECYRVVAEERVDRSSW